MDLHGRSILLTLVGRRPGPLEDVAEQVRAAGSQVHVVPADITLPGAPADIVAQATERFGGIEVLVNNSGNVRAGRLEQVSEQEGLAQLAEPDRPGAADPGAADEGGAARAAHLRRRPRRLGDRTGRAAVLRHLRGQRPECAL